MPERRDVFMRNSLIRTSLYQATYERMKVDPLIFLIGEGAKIKTFYDFKPIYNEMNDRILQWPIAEDSGLNAAMGANLMGVKMIFNIITFDFAYRTFDSISNTIATTMHILGKDAVPLVIQAEFLLFSPSTGQRGEALYSHIPNISVVIPSTPIDAYGLMLEALQTNQATMVLEDRMIVDAKTKDADKFPSILPPARMGGSRIRRMGNGLTIVSYALTRQRTEEVLDAHPEWDVEFIDMYSIKPYDKEIILASALRTKKLLIIEHDIVGFGVGAEIIAMVTEAASKKGTFIKVKRIGAPMHTIPASQALHDYMIPNNERIERAIKEMLA